MLTHTLQRIINVQGGFLTSTDVAELKQFDRLRQVLVRCGNGRFLCAAQDVDHFSEIIASDGRDYVRDVSLPSSDAAFRGSYHAHTFEGGYQPQRKPIEKPARSGFPNHCYSRDQDYGGAFDGVNVISDADPGL